MIARRRSVDLEPQPTLALARDVRRLAPRFGACVRFTSSRIQVYGKRFDMAPTRSSTTERQVTSADNSDLNNSYKREIARRPPCDVRGD